MKAIKANGAARMAGHGGSEKSIVFTQSEINDYISSWIEQESKARKHPEIAVRSANVRLKPGRVVEADATVRFDISALKALGGSSQSIALKTLTSYLAIDNSIQVQAMVVSAKGKAFISPQVVKIKGITIPESLVKNILQIVGKKQRPPLDFSRLFDLPNGIQKMDVLPDSVKVTWR